MRSVEVLTPSPPTRFTSLKAAVYSGLFIGGGVLRGAGDARTPLRVTALANLLNVALAYALIYGHFGLPALGPIGSAWATFLARSFALVLLLTALWRGRNGVSISGRGGWRPDFGVARQVLSVGIPAALEQVLVSSGFLVLALVVARLGTEVLAAQRITFNALSLSFLPGIGFGIAATALVGQSVGARRIGEGQAVARVATNWAVLWMSAIAALLIVFAPQIFHSFTSDAAVIEAGVPGLRVLALTQPFWAVLFVQAGALRGTGNTRFPLMVTGTSIWAAVGLAFALLETVGGASAGMIARLDAPHHALVFAADAEWAWPDGDPWPTVRTRGDLALVGLTTSQASGLLMGHGTLGDKQLVRTHELTVAHAVIRGNARIVCTVKAFDPGKKLTVTGPMVKDYSFDLDEKDNAVVMKEGVAVGQRVKVTYTKTDSGDKITAIAPYRKHA